MKIRKIFVFLLASVLLLALSACSEKEASDPNCFDLGKYEIYYKGSCIMYSETGKDALVMTFDFTNNSKGTASYGLNVCEKLMQNGEEMESAYVITDMETYAGVSGDYFTTVEPGQTIEVSTSRVLNGMDEVTMTLSDLSGKRIYNITVDPSTLTRVENEYPGQSDSDEQSSSEESVAGTGSQQFSSEAGTSIDVLREEISQSTAPFGIAYIGYFDSATADDSGIDFPQWFYAVTSALNENYPFVLEIDEEHIIGTEGFLYCVIAGDYNTSISVNSIDSNELLYRSENGDPVLLFCNHDGDAQKADTTVIITTEDGTEYQWEPTLDENMEHPKLLVGNERELLSWDFTLTPFQNMEFDLDSWLSEGWSGPTAVGLANDSNGATGGSATGITA